MEAFELWAGYLALGTLYLVCTVILLLSISAALIFGVNGIRLLFATRAGFKDKIIYAEHENVTRIEHKRMSDD